ncbi:hypothetical protein EOM39_07485, partial [Candidatus Gracilibacteria bacterium]|nr:hypothetical protein [Candidatus Gracilibacteria bacterium]
MTIKEKILKELENPKIPDLKFLFSKEVLDETATILLDLLKEEKEKFDSILKVKDTDITFELFQDFSRLDLLFSLLNHLNNVNSSDKTRKIIEQFEPKYVDFGNYISYSRRYYDMLVYCRKKYSLDNEQKRILDLSIKAYEVRGIKLDQVKQKRLKEINKKLSKLSTRFGNNVLDSRKKFSFIFKNDTLIKDIPENDLLDAKNKAEKKGKKGYLFDASSGAYEAIMKYCIDPKIREYFYTERNKFASEGKLDNRPLVIEILKLKQEKAHILGYKNYAELSLVFKMADKPKEIISLIDKVSKKAKKKAIKEIETLKKYFKLIDIHPYDLAYYSRIYKEKKYKFEEKELKKYFEFDKVLKGLFEITNRLYGLEMKEIKIDSYSPDIKVYEVYKDDKLLSYFIGDYFFNENKRSGAWCDNLRPKQGIRDKGQGKSSVIASETKQSREQLDRHELSLHSNSRDDKVLLPIVINVCAFAKQESGKIFLNHIDVETMFHEFGHALHEMLSKSKYSDLSGFNVEWDFVELPSQIMENWCNEEESLNLFASHYENGTKIPKKMLKIMDKLKTYG